MLVINILRFITGLSPQKWLCLAGLSGYPAVPQPVENQSFWLAKDSQPIKYLLRK
jgi:hypothetical protein